MAAAHRQTRAAVAAEARQAAARSRLLFRALAQVHARAPARARGFLWRRLVVRIGAPAVAEVEAARVRATDSRAAFPAERRVTRLAEPVLEYQRQATELFLREYSLVRKARRCVRRA